MLQSLQVNNNYGSCKQWVTIGNDQVYAVAVQAGQYTFYGVRVDNPTGITDLNIAFGTNYSIGLEVPYYALGQTHIANVYCVRTMVRIPFTIKWVERIRQA